MSARRGRSRSRSPVRRRAGSDKEEEGRERGRAKRSGRHGRRRRRRSDDDSSSSDSSMSSSDSSSSSSSSSSDSSDSSSDSSGASRSRSRQRKHSRRKHRRKKSSKKHSRKHKKHAKKHKKHSKRHKKDKKKHKKDKKKHKSKHKKETETDEGGAGFATQAEADFVREMSGRIAAKTGGPAEPSHLEKLAEAGRQAAKLLKQDSYKAMRKVTRMKATAVAVPDSNGASFVMASKANVSFRDKMAFRKSEKRHASLRKMAKLGRKAAAEAQKEKEKMDALLASCGISRDKL